MAFIFLFIFSLPLIESISTESEGKVLHPFPRKRYHTPVHPHSPLSSNPISESPSDLDNILLSTTHTTSKTSSISPLSQNKEKEFFLIDELQKQNEQNKKKLNGLSENRFSILSSSISSSTDTSSTDTSATDSLLSSTDNEKLLETTEFPQWDLLPGFGAYTPSKREGHTLTAVKDHIYVFGGCYLDVTCYNDLHIFFTKNNSWLDSGEVFARTSGTIPSPRGKHTATLVKDKIFVFAGSCEELQGNDVYVLQTGSLLWTKPEIGGTRPRPREGHAATVVDSKIFIFGGRSGNEYLDDLFVLDTENLVWSQPKTSGPTPKPRSGHSFLLPPPSLVDGAKAETEGNVIFLFGGESNSGSLNDVSVFDPHLMSWSVWDKITGSPPKPRSGHVAVFDDDNQLFLYGGCNFRNHECYNDTLILDVQARRWGAPIIIPETNPPPALIQSSSSSTTKSQEKENEKESEDVLTDTKCDNSIDCDMSLIQTLSPVWTPPRQYGSGCFIPSTLRIYLFGGCLGKKCYFDFISFDVSNSYSLLDLKDVNKILDQREEQKKEEQKKQKENIKESKSTPTTTTESSTTTTQSFLQKQEIILSKKLEMQKSKNSLQPLEKNKNNNSSFLEEENTQNLLTPILNPKVSLSSSDKMNNQDQSTTSKLASSSSSSSSSSSTTPLKLTTHSDSISSTNDISSKSDSNDIPNKIRNTLPLAGSTTTTTTTANDELASETVLQKDEQESVGSTNNVGTITNSNPASIENTRIELKNSNMTTSSTSNSNSKEGLENKEESEKDNLSPSIPSSPSSSSQSPSLTLARIKQELIHLNTLRGQTTENEKISSATVKHSDTQSSAAASITQPQSPSVYEPQIIQTSQREENEVHLSDGLAQSAVEISQRIKLQQSNQSVAGAMFWPLIIMILALFAIGLYLYGESHGRMVDFNSLKFKNQLLVEDHIGDMETDEQMTSHRQHEEEQYDFERQPHHQQQQDRQSKGTSRTIDNITSENSDPLRFPSSRPPPPRTLPPLPGIPPSTHTPVLISPSSDSSISSTS